MPMRRSRVLVGPYRRVEGSEASVALSVERETKETIRASAIGGHSPAVCSFVAYLYLYNTKEFDMSS
jgi:hypothetical protein